MKRLDKAGKKQKKKKNVSDHRGSGGEGKCRYPDGVV